MGRKGGGYERELCRDFSRWWTHGERDDIYWRAQASGGRATVRERVGLSTHGQYGDMAATHPMGEPLLDLITIEAKRGYSRHTVADLLDRPGPKSVQVYDVFLQQTIRAHEAAGSFSWMLIHKRDSRPATVLMPWDLIQEFRHEGVLQTFPADAPFVRTSFTLLLSKKRPGKKSLMVTGRVPMRVASLPLSEWFRQVTPVIVKRMIKRV